MAVSPGTYNITLQRRADYSVTLQFKDSTDTPINLTGWTVAVMAHSLAVAEVVAAQASTASTPAKAATAALATSASGAGNYDQRNPLRNLRQRRSLH